MTRYVIKRESYCLHLSVYGDLEIPQESQDLAIKDKKGFDRFARDQFPPTPRSREETH